MKAMASVAKRPLKRKTAMILAVLSMWLIGGIGLGLMHSNGWHFFLLHGYDVGTLGQIGGYYLARIGAQTLGVGLAAIIIGLSDFQRPVRTASLTAFCYFGITTTIRVVRQPWAVAPDLYQGIPVLAEVAQLILLIAFAALLTWLFVWLATWLETGPLAGHFRR